MDSNVPAHANPKYDAVYRFLCGLADRDLPCPQMRGLAKMVGLTPFSVGNAFYALRKTGLIRTASKHTAFGRRYVVVKIVSSGKKTAAPGHQDSSAASCRDPVPPHDGTIVRRDNPDLPSGQSDGNKSAVNPRRCQTEPAAGAGQPQGRPALLSERSTGRWRGLNVGPDSYVPDIDRIRQINAALPKAVVLPASWGCQYISNDRWPYQFCGEKRADGSSYCLTHHGICCAGTLRHHIALTPEERAKRIEHGRKIKAAMARKRHIEALRERQHQPGA